MEPSCAEASEGKHGAESIGQSPKSREARNPAGNRQNAKDRKEQEGRRRNLEGRKGLKTRKASGLTAVATLVLHCLFCFLDPFEDS